MKEFFQIERSIADSHRARSVQIALLQAVILAAFLHSMAAAEGPIYAVQDALKRELFYFGERTGVLDPATRSALRLFQTRHGLPNTGEIDTETLKALQSSTEVNRSVIESQPPATKEPAPSEAIVAKDREFLRNLEAIETDREQTTASPSEHSVSSVPPPTAVTDPEPMQAPETAQSLLPTANPAPTVAPGAEPPPSPDEPTVASSSTSDEATQPSRKAEVRKRTVEKPRSLARRKVEQPTRAQSSDSPPRQERELEPIGSAPSRQVEPRVVEIDEEPEPLDSGGARIIRSTRKISPDGRTQSRTTTYPGTVAPTIRRAEPVEPRRKNEGFFDRLFKDDD